MLFGELEEHRRLEGTLDMDVVFALLIPKPVNI